MFVEALDRLVDQAALVGGDQVDAGFEVLGAAFLPRHKHAAAQGGGDLHGADAGAGGDAVDRLDGQAGEAGDFERAVDAVVVGQEGVLAVEMPAAAQQVLLVAEDHPPVGEVGMRLFVQDVLPGVAVELQGNAVVAGELDQARQDEVVAVGAHNHIRVVSFEQVAQAVDHLAAFLAREAQLFSIDTDEQIGAVAAVRVAQFAGKLQGHHPQRRQGIVDRPGGVACLKCPDEPVFVFDRDIGEREGVPGEDIALRDGDVGIVVCQVRMGFGNLAEDPVELHRLEDADLEYLDGAVKEQVEAFGALQAHRGAAGLQQAADGVQLAVRPAHVESWCKGILQRVRAAVLVDQPHGHSAGRRVGVEQPAVQGGHGSEFPGYFVEAAAQFEHFLVLFHQHGQQHDFERQQV